MSSIDQLQPMGWAVSLPHAMRQVAATAQAKGTPACLVAAGLLEQLAHDSGLDESASFTIRVSVRDVMVSAVDEARRRGDTVMVDRLESIIQKLQDGTSGIITGVMQRTFGTVSELDDSLEAIRKQSIIQKRG